MNKFFYKGWVLLGAIFAFSACQEKEMYAPADSSGNVTDLVVPAGFDWEMSASVALSFESPVETVVDIYLSPNCQQGLLATLAISQGSEKTVSVPANAEILYVRYPKEDTTQGVIPVRLSDTRANSRKKVILPEDAGRFDKKQSVMYYPSNGWGTVLFEDNWPLPGDYDFNDLAAWYKIQVYTEDHEKEDVTGIMLSLRLNGLGGDYPYQLCLQMDELDTDDIADIYMPYPDKTGKYELLSQGDDPAVLCFDWEVLKGGNSGKYYNTEKKYEVPESELDKNQMVIMIELKDDEDMEDFTHDKFNFFIRRKDNGQEIHLLGYKPTKVFKESYHSIVSEHIDLDPDRYYGSKKGFVWGIKVPIGIAHAQEGVDFRMAYKFFGDWVTSGGKNHKNWYEEQSGKEYRININKTK